jgi:hypothetical protein
MSWIIDALVLALVALVALVEARRGLLLTLTDILRIGLALAGGFGAYSVIHRLSHNYAAGFAALGTVALGLVLLVPFLVRRSGLDPAWSRSIAARLAAGLIGAGIGAAIVVTFMPIANQRPRLQTAIAESLLGSTALDAAPFFYYAADALNLDLPMLNRRARRFEDEGALERAALVERINYTRLDGSTCIECRASARFRGYRRRFEASVSPRFVCPRCGRTSDGCQTFEGFHRMYGRCPADVAAELGPIDCGVWPNGRAVYPQGPCPIDGREIGRLPRSAPARSQRRSNDTGR